MMILILQCHYSSQKGLLSVLYNKCNNDGEGTIKNNVKVYKSIAKWHTWFFNPAEFYGLISDLFGITE